MLGNLLNEIGQDGELYKTCVDFLFNHFFGEFPLMKSVGQVPSVKKPGLHIPLLTMRGERVNKKSSEEFLRVFEVLQKKRQRQFFVNLGSDNMHSLDYLVDRI